MLLLVALFLVSVSCQGPTLDKTAWPVSALGSPSGGLRSQILFPATAPTQLLFSQNLTAFDGDITASILLGDDSIVLGTREGAVLKLDASTGKIVWNVTLPALQSAGCGAFQYCPNGIAGLVSFNSGNVLVSGYNWAVFQIDAQGVLTKLVDWSVPANMTVAGGGAGIIGPAVLTSNGFASLTGDGFVRFFDMATSSPMQSYQINESNSLNQNEAKMIQSSITGVIYVASSNGTLFVFQNDGTALWQKDMKNNIRCLILDEAEEYLYLGNFTDVVKLNATDGSPSWRVTGVFLSTELVDFFLGDGLLYYPQLGEVPLIFNTSDGSQFDLKIDCNNSALFTHFEIYNVVDPKFSTLYTLNTRIYGCGSQIYPAQLISGLSSAASPLPVPTWQYAIPDSLGGEHVAWYQPLVRSDGLIYLVGNFEGPPNGESDAIVVALLK